MMRPANLDPNAPSPLLTVVLATSNQGKIRELQAVLDDLPVQLKSVAEVLGKALDTEEDGDTFQANAEKKARAVCEATGMLALADDSGLQVDALGGLPGVRSARYAHEGASDEENNAALLKALDAVAQEAPAARFCCVLALVSPWDDRVWFAEGFCEGTITRNPRGCHGFGYDPLFVVGEFGGRTMAELEPVEKNRISHRARAAHALAAILREVVDAHRTRGHSSAD